MFYKLLHNRRNGRDLPDKSFWPHSWVTVLVKQYQRFNKVSLTNDRMLDVSLQKVLEKRCSSSEPSSIKLNTTMLGHLLYYSVGIKNLKPNISLSQTQLDQTRRFYPSAGARYPLEMYVVANRVDGLSQHTYHYNVLTHTLEEIRPKPLCREVLNTFLHKWVEEAQCILLISTMQYRSSIKYLDAGYLMALIECGHMAQNIVLNATAMNLNSCPLYGINRSVLQEILDFDDDELLLYAVVIT